MTISSYWWKKCDIQVMFAIFRYLGGTISCLFQQSDLRRRRDRRLDSGGWRMNSFQKNFNGDKKSLTDHLIRLNVKLLLTKWRSRSKAVQRFLVKMLGCADDISNWYTRCKFWCWLICWCWCWCKRRFCQRPLLSGKLCPGQGFDRIWLKRIEVVLNHPLWC